MPATKLRARATGTPGQTNRVHLFEVGDRIITTRNKTLGRIGWVLEVQPKFCLIQFEDNGEIKLLGDTCFNFEPTAEQYAHRIAEVQATWTPAKELDHRVVKPRVVEILEWHGDDEA